MSGVTHIGSVWEGVISSANRAWDSLRALLERVWRAVRGYFCEQPPLRARKVKTEDVLQAVRLMLQIAESKFGVKKGPKFKIVVRPERRPILRRIRRSFYQPADRKLREVSMATISRTSSRSSFAEFDAPEFGIISESITRASSPTGLQLKWMQDQIASAERRAEAAERTVADLQARLDRQFAELEARLRPVTVAKPAEPAPVKQITVVIKDNTPEVKEVGRCSLITASILFAGIAAGPLGLAAAGAVHYGIAKQQGHV
jgi:hypothetical protein